jgi:hypothetical protein
VPYSLSMNWFSVKAEALKAIAAPKVGALAR